MVKQEEEDETNFNAFPIPTHYYAPTKQEEGNHFPPSFPIAKPDDQVVASPQAYTGGSSAGNQNHSGPPPQIRQHAIISSQQQQSGSHTATRQQADSFAVRLPLVPQQGNSHSVGGTQRSASSAVRVPSGSQGTNPSAVSLPSPSQQTTTFTSRPPSGQQQVTTFTSRPLSGPQQQQLSSSIGSTSDRPQQSIPRPPGGQQQQASPSIDSKSGGLQQDVARPPTGQQSIPLTAPQNSSLTVAQAITFATRIPSGPQQGVTPPVRPEKNTPQVPCRCIQASLTGNCSHPQPPSALSQQSSGKSVRPPWQRIQPWHNSSKTGSNRPQPDPKKSQAGPSKPQAGLSASRPKQAVPNQVTPSSNSLARTIASGPQGGISNTLVQPNQVTALPSTLSIPPANLATRVLTAPTSQPHAGPSRQGNLESLHVEVPPIDPRWRKIALRRATEIRLLREGKRPDQVARKAQKQPKKSAIHSVHRPLKRPRVDTEGTSVPPEIVVIPATNTSAVRQRNRMSPIRSANPYKPYFSSPFLETEYPADAESALYCENQQQSSFFGRQHRSDAARVAASSRGHVCQWMTRARTIFDPQGECCGRAFISAELMIKHVVKAHLTEPFACRWHTCTNRLFRDQESLQKHLLKQHLETLAWSCPYHECRLSSSKPANEQQSKVHEEKAHDSLYERLRPLALPRKLSSAFNAPDFKPPPALSSDSLQMWQVTMTIPKVSKFKARLTPKQLQEPSAQESGGLVGPQQKPDRGGAAPWSMIMPILDHLEPFAEPYQLTFPRQEQEWHIDMPPNLSGELDTSALQVETPESPQVETTEEESSSVESTDVEMATTAHTPFEAVQSISTLSDLPTASHPPRRACSESLSATLKRDASTQTDTFQSLVVAQRRRLVSSPPPSYHEVMQQQSLMSTGNAGVSIASDKEAVLSATPDRLKAHTEEAVQSADSDSLDVFQKVDIGVQNTVTF
ncbi:unnamed protein product [Sympodiomycopsis kandeliae]